MTMPSAPLAIAAGLLVLFLALGLALIPALDAELRRANARRLAADGANDNVRAAGRRAERQIG